MKDEIKVYGNHLRQSLMNEIKRLVKEKGLKRREVCDVWGVSEATVNVLFNKRWTSATVSMSHTSISLDRLFYFLEVLGGDPWTPSFRQGLGVCLPKGFKERESVPEMSL